MGLFIASCYRYRTRLLVIAVSSAVDPYSFLRILIQLFFSIWIRIQFFLYGSRSEYSLHNCEKNVPYQECSKVKSMQLVRIYLTILSKLQLLLPISQHFSFFNFLLLDPCESKSGSTGLAVPSLNHRYSTLSWDSPEDKERSLFCLLLLS